MICWLTPLLVRQRPVAHIIPTSRRFYAGNLRSVIDAPLKTAGIKPAARQPTSGGGV
jgi:hypothetical protein